EDRITWPLLCGMVCSQQPPDSKGRHFTFQQTVNFPFSPLPESLLGYRYFTEPKSRAEHSLLYNGSWEARIDYIKAKRAQAVQEVSAECNTMRAQEKQDYSKSSVCIVLETAYRTVHTDVEACSAGTARLKNLYYEND
ncbi:hypothetical protein KEM55_001287, partial [Ascosphaera atra]